MLLLLASAALASWPDDINLSQLAVKGDTAVLDPADNVQVYETVLRELVRPSPISPCTGRTLWARMALRSA